MTAHDAQTLMALRHYEREGYSTEARPRCSDVGVADAGEVLFGADWTLVKSSRYEYAPLVSMSLGRLRRFGLVRHTGVVANASYRFWALTDEGRLEGDRLLGEAR